MTCYSTLLVIWNRTFFWTIQSHIFSVEVFMWQFMSGKHKRRNFYWWCFAKQPENMDYTKRFPNIRFKEENVKENCQFPCQSIKNVLRATYMSHKWARLDRKLKLNGGEQKSFQKIGSLEIRNLVKHLWFIFHWISENKGNFCCSLPKTKVREWIPVNRVLPNKWCHVYIEINVERKK